MHWTAKITNASGWISFEPGNVVSRHQITGAHFIFSAGNQTAQRSTHATTFFVGVGAGWSSRPAVMTNFGHAEAGWPLYAKRKGLYAGIMTKHMI